MLLVDDIVDIVVYVRYTTSLAVVFSCVFTGVKDKVVVLAHVARVMLGFVFL